MKFRLEIGCCDGQHIWRVCRPSNCSSATCCFRLKRCRMHSHFEACAATCILIKSSRFSALSGLAASLVDFRRRILQTPFTILQISFLSGMEFFCLCLTKVAGPAGEGICVSFQILVQCSNRFWCFTQYQDLKPSVNAFRYKVTLK